MLTNRHVEYLYHLRQAEGGLEDACHLAGVHMSTVWRWRRASRDFDRAVLALAGEYVEQLEDERDDDDAQDAYAYALHLLEG